MTQATTARRAALALVRAVTEERRLLADLTAPDHQGPLARLTPAERATAQRLALATLRRIGPADAVLAPLLQRRPKPAVRALLRLAMAELDQQPAAAHGIVSAAVTIARSQPATAAAAGFVNAVLRRLTAAPLRLTVQQLPDWLRAPLLARHGAPVVAAIEAAHLAGPVLDLTPRDPASAADWAGRLDARLLPTGSLRLPLGAQVSALPGHAEGAWWVQDAAAALPARLLAPAPGERVLDLCAAPGGKTLQLAAAGARVTALDVSARRLRRLHQNLARTGLSAEVVTADATDWPAPAPFPAILLDAPCSATGTIRRHPDLPVIKSAADVAALVAMQVRLIDRAVALLAPGGRLVYCTCSLLPAEGEGQLAAALARHPDLRLDPVVPQGVPAEWLAPGGGLRIRPDHWADAGGIDGFFIARLRKRR